MHTCQYVTFKSNKLSISKFHNFRKWNLKIFDSVHSRHQCHSSYLCPCSFLTNSCVLGLPCLIVVVVVGPGVVVFFCGDNISISSSSSAYSKRIDIVIVQCIYYPYKILTRKKSHTLNLYHQNTSFNL